MYSALVVDKMPFHHVLLSVEPEGRLKRYFSDLSEKELEMKFLKPYRKGRNIVCGNEVLSVMGIKTVHVVRTEKNDEMERAILQKTSYEEVQKFNRESNGIVLVSAGTGYDPVDILEVGEDLTSKFIVGPPGYASGPNIVARLLHNPWTVGVGTAVIAGVIIWWRGWN